MPNRPTRTNLAPSGASATACTTCAIAAAGAEDEPECTGRDPSDGQCPLEDADVFTAAAAASTATWYLQGFAFLHAGSPIAWEPRHIWQTWCRPAGQGDSQAPSLELTLKQIGCPSAVVTYRPR